MQIVFDRDTAVSFFPVNPEVDLRRSLTRVSFSSGPICFLSGDDEARSDFIRNI
jgi:hypothetical protein